jgi:ABC-type phosphate/phosphonate transport system substrate-binding protein
MKKFWIDVWLVFCGVLFSGMPLMGTAIEDNSATLNPNFRFLVHIGLDLAGIDFAKADLKDIQTAWDVWYGELGERYGIFSEIHFYDDIQALQQDFNAGKLDVVSASALNFFRMAPQIAAKRDTNIYGAVKRNKKTYQYVLLIRSDAGVSDLKDLRGKTLVMRKNDEAGLFYLNTLLLRNGQAELQQFLGAMQEMESFSKAMLSVFFKKNDACLVTDTAFETMCELNPQMGKQLTILAHSTELSNGIFFFARDLPQGVKNILVNHVLHLDASRYGQQILMLYKIDRLVQFDITDLDSIKVLFQEYEALKRQPQP